MSSPLTADATIDRAVITVTGPDTIDFLQGQLTADVAGLEIGSSTRTFLLAPQGHVIAWLRATRTGPEEIVLDGDAGVGPEVETRLRRFLLRTKATVEARVARCRCVRGGGQEAPVGSLVLACDWPGIDGWDVLDPTAETPGGSGGDDLEALRVAAGVPVHGSEITEKTIPNELPVLRTSVSFTKGCYVGQELVARVDSRGNNVPQRLARLESDGELTPGDLVTADGAAAGSITSAVGSDGLGLVRRSVDDGTLVHTANGVDVRVATLPEWP